MNNRADAIARRAACMARTFGIKTASRNGHSLYSLVDNDISNRMHILYTTDGWLNINIGAEPALRRRVESDYNELCNGFGDELERRLGLTVEEVSI